MAEKGFKRKLAAILSADVEGYSRLMDQDKVAGIWTKAFVKYQPSFRGIIFFWYLLEIFNLGRNSSVNKFSCGAVMGLIFLYRK